MLIVLQFAFADLRNFSALRDEKTSKPNWHLLSPNGFVRGFGQIESRYRRLKSPQLRIQYKREKVEKHYVNCTRSAFPVFDENSRPTTWTRCNHVYSRLISDGKLSFRMEVGVHVETPDQPSISQFEKILKYILESDFHFRDRVKSTKKVYTVDRTGAFSDLSSKLRNRIQTKTTLHSASDTGEKINTDFLDSLGVLVFADLSEHTLDESITSESLVSAPDAPDIDIAFLERQVGGTDIGLWLLGKNVSNQRGADDDALTDKLRRIRLHILRFSSELRALEVAVGSAVNGVLEFDDGVSSFEAFETMVSTSLERLAHTSNEASVDLGELAIGKYFNAEALFDVVERIESNLYSLGGNSTKGFSNQMSSIRNNSGTILFVNNPQADKDIYLNAVGGDQVSGDQFKGNRAGIVAGKMKATNINVYTSWSEFDPSGEFDPQQLAGELAKLKEAMQSKASTEEELDEVSAVQKASLAAENDDKSKILEHLSNAGKWTLSIAEKIGVPVAIAVLKKMAGM